MHIGLIPDGNRRYAKSNGLSVEEGYRKGFDTIISIIDGLFNINNKPSGIDLAIDVLTIYVCSVDNLTKRSQTEIACIHEAISNFIDYHHENRKKMLTVKINIIGNLRYLPRLLRNRLESIRKKTANYTGNILNLAIGYDAHIDMIHYNRKAQKQYGKITVNGYKKIHPVSAIDLIIRTGFEKRISGFFPLQASYAELFFLDKYFPEFTIQDIKAIVEDYKTRQRRYGC